MLILQVLILLGLVVSIVLSIMRKTVLEPDTEKTIAAMRTEVDRLASALKTDSSINKTEINQTLIALKAELNQNLKDNRSELSENLEKIRRTIDDKMTENTNAQASASQISFKKQEDIRKETESKLELMRVNTENLLENIRSTVQHKLESLQEANAKKLDEMRQTVDEKLQQTLTTRLSESFKQVSEQLDKVHSGLGSMTALANDVGGLKKVLTNVKTRGIIGEIQLESLLSSVLSPEQYECNVQTRPNSQQRVEFAIKLPGNSDSDRPCYLPIDSKFPDASYQKLLEAYDNADTLKITLARKELMTSIKTSAKDIRDKYIEPPFTTEWGILFLPFEGLYAEVLQNTDLVHSLQTEYQITLAGPTTLGAFINSLQMGFRTLAIQKRSGEVWQTLGEVKQQFLLFGNVLEAAQKKIRGAGDDIEKLVGTRTRMIQSKLKNVEILVETPIAEITEIEDKGMEESDE